MGNYMRKLRRVSQYGPRIIVGKGMPEQESQWDMQYGGSHWNYLSGIEQLGRYSIIAGYSIFMKPLGRVLDVGCGEGILLERLGDTYSEFVGIDISDVALRRARERIHERAIFLKEDVENPSSAVAGKFDVIVFNEVLYYCADPLGTMRKYERYLNYQGIFIVSIHCRWKHFFIWKKFENVYPILDRVVIKHRTTSWRIWVFDAVAGTRLSKGDHENHQSGANPEHHSYRAGCVG